ncbi:odorant receptor 4-like isoform X2 [Halictus rubicundus]|uniref:odorant receptor 4-like isoform X2 n=1 Tax=Halictus rubicundus TaxID=77578 RepID=UPI0040352FE1
MTPVIVQQQNTDKPRNPYYEKDIVYIFKHSRFILNFLGIWPKLLKNSNQYQQNVSIGLCNVVLLFAIIPYTLYFTVEEKSLMIRVKAVGSLCFCWLSLLKYWVLIACRPTLRYCIEFVQHDWKEVEKTEDRELMLKYGNVGRNLTILCLVFMYSGGLMYLTIAQYAAGTYVDEHNRTIRPLVYPTYSKLFDVQVRPVYELVYAVHSLNGCIVSSITVGTCGLAALFVTHICGQIDVMIQRLQNLTQLGVHTDLHPKLIRIVQHHVRTIRFSSSVGKLLQEVCFLEFIGCTFVICLLEYYTIMDWEVNNTLSLMTYAMLLVSLMFNIFILCYIGDLLVEKTGNVGSMCFMIDWYKFPVGTMRSLILIIAMSNNPAKITAGHIADLNLSTFGSILKTSLGYLSFIRTAMM